MSAPPTPGDLVNDTAGAVVGPLFDALREVVPVLIPWLVALLVVKWAVGFLPSIRGGDSSGMDFSDGSDAARGAGVGSHDGGLNLSPRTYRQYAREAREEGDDEQAKHWSRKAQAAARSQANGRRAGHRDNARYKDDAYNGQSSW